MAQIIKHRRGSIGSLKSTTARNAELIIASGSISDLSGPFVFIGSPNSGDEGIAGAFNTVSKLYTGTNAPTITAATYGSGLDGTPYYASGDKSLYILNNSNVGNTKVDLTGNIEGNTISGVTINNLTGTTATFDTINLNTISFTGLTEGRVTLVGPGGSLVDSGSLNMNNGQLGISGSIKLNDSAYIYHDGGLYIDDTTNGLQLSGGNNAYFGINGNGYSKLHATDGLDVQATNGELWLWSDLGDAWLSAYDGNTLHLNADGGEGTVRIGNGSNDLNVNSTNTAISGSNTTRIGQSNHSGYFYTSDNYAEMYGGTGLDVYTNGGNLWVYNNSGDVAISSYDGYTLYLNTDGGEGDVQIGNSSNNLYGYTVITDIQGTNYAQLKSNGSYVLVNEFGAYIQNNNSGVSGVTARNSNIVEITGSLQANGDASFTGSITISGHETVDYINGLTHEWNYLAFNGGAIGTPGVELSSATNISLWAEGGRINVTGSMNVTGSASVTGSLIVTDGAAFIDQGVVAQNSDVLLTSGSSLYINDGGSAYISGDLWVTGNTYTTGSIYTQGDIVLSGSINIGDNITTDVINFNGEVSSSIIPKINDAFDLGSSDNYWRDLYVSGTAHVGVLEADSITLSGITVFNDLQVSGSIYNFTLSPTDVVFVDGDQRLTGSASFTYGYNGDYETNILTAESIRASNNGSGLNFQIGDDMWLGDVNDANATRFMGAQDNNLAKIYLGTDSTNNYLYADYSNVYLSANNNLYLQSQNSNVRIDSYDGSIRLNRDSNNNVLIGGNTYIDGDRTLYTNLIYDNNNNNNYLQTSGWGTNNSNWWESGNGNDTTLLNNDGNNNLNILQTNNGKVNIDAPSVHLHTNNGFNVTGSLVVSDGSGVFNSSLITSNSDLYLESGSNQHMMNGAHLYFDTCVDIYYDNNDGNLIFYNDCNNFQFRNNVSITGSLNISSGIYTDNIYGATNNSNVLRFNGGSYGAPNVELASSGQISLFSEGGGNTFAINMTGSVHMANDLDVSGSIYAGGMYNYNSNINGGGIYIDSGNYSEISYNDEESYVYVSGDGVWAQSNTGQNHFISNGGDTTINANNGYNVNINTNDLLINANTAVTGALSVSADTSLLGNLYVSGNLEVLGSSTNVNLESHTVNIGDNIILVNAYSPFQRYAGLAAFDSGSSGVSGSLLWDSLNDYWMFVSASGQSSKLIGTTAGTYGSENNLTSNMIPVATGSNTIGDSLLGDDGTTLTYNTNKFTIDSASGDTYINGNVTLNSGASDLGSKTSGIVFRNDDDILGFVSTTETTDVMDGVLGYRSSDGVLVFSTVIDGGSY